MKALLGKRKDRKQKTGVIEEDENPVLALDFIAAPREFGNKYKNKEESKQKKDSNELP